MTSDSEMLSLPSSSDRVPRPHLRFLGLGVSCSVMNAFCRRAFEISVYKL